MVAGIQIVLDTPRTVVAHVLDDIGGIFDVTRGAATGWSCSCGDVDNRSVHIACVTQLIDSKVPRP
jgi:hypothetical protein